MSAKKRVLVVTIAMLAFLLALLITLYPLISTWYNDRHQAQIHVQYKEELNQKDDSEIRNARKLAEAYNKAIAEIDEDVADANENLRYLEEKYGKNVLAAV